MSLEDDVWQAVTAGESQAGMNTAAVLADQGGVLIARFWNNLRTCAVPEDVARELVLQAGDIYWTKVIGLPPCGCGPEGPA